MQGDPLFQVHLVLMTKEERGSAEGDYGCDEGDYDYGESYYQCDAADVTMGDIHDTSITTDKWVWVVICIVSFFVYIV